VHVVNTVAMVVACIGFTLMHGQNLNLTMAYTRLRDHSVCKLAHFFGSPF
jgi:hypothetical protein